ncbi:Os01g0627916, partial [Oryza sativa Japonica Group]
MTSPVRICISGQTSTSYEPSEPRDSIHLLTSSSQHAENAGSMSCRFLEMESRVKDPPVLDPLLAFVVGEAIRKQLRQSRELGLLKVAELVGQDALGQVGVGDCHLRRRAEPGEARAAVLPDGVVEERRDARRDVVAPQRQRPRPGLPVQPPVLPEVAGEEAVARAAEALRAQRQLQTPRPPPQAVQQAAGLPQEHQAQDTVRQEAPWHGGWTHQPGSKNHCWSQSMSASEWSEKELMQVCFDYWRW